MFTVVDSRQPKPETKVTTLSLLEKKKQNLKFVGFFRGAMVQTTTCNHNIGSQQQCNKNLQKKVIPCDQTYKTN